MMAGIFFVVSINRCLGEWINIGYTPVKEIDAKNHSAASSSVIFEDPVQNEFSCEKIHNLTMMSFAGKTRTSAAADEYFDTILKDFDDLPDNRKDNIKKKKENILEALKLKIQLQIEDRIKKLEQQSGREARSSHSGFPSMESALVSISLLLFAVYLIKLVMKLIYTFHLKKGATEVVGLLSNIRQPLIFGQSRQAKSFSQEMESWKMRDLIEEQHLRFN